MSLNIRIEYLPEPELLFGSNEKGVEPRRVMAKHGAADKSAPRELRIGIVGSPVEVQIAREWLPRLNRMAIAREKSARRYPNWPGAQQVLGVTFVIEERFVRSVDEDKLNLALHRPSSSEKFDDLLELFDAKIQGFLATLGPIVLLCASLMNSPTCASATPSSPRESVRLWSACSGRRNKSRCLSFSQRPRN